MVAFCIKILFYPPNLRSDVYHSFFLRTSLDLVNERDVLSFQSNSHFLRFLPIVHLWLVTEVHITTLMSSVTKSVILGRHCVVKETWGETFGWQLGLIYYLAKKQTTKITT